jgi:hypothetical protein
MTSGGSVRIGNGKHGADCSEMLTGHFSPAFARPLRDLRHAGDRAAGIGKFPELTGQAA